MTTRKRNEWLEADIEDEENAYESEEEEESRGVVLSHSRKRIKTQGERISDLDDDDDEDEEDSNFGAARNDADGDGALESEEKLRHSPPVSAASAETKPSKAQRQLAKKRDAVSGSGVMYILHILPFMKPHTL